MLKGITKNLYTKTYTSDISAGGLSKEWATKLKLKEGIAITVGAFDPHMGAVGAQIKEGVFVKVLGTSCCDMAVGPKLKDETLIAGICGQVNGSIIPGLLGCEAGQSSFGDVYAWFKDVLAWPIKSILLNTKIINKSISNKLSEEVQDNIIRVIEQECQKISSSDTKTHLELYKEFEDIGGVVHTHSRFATAWAQSKKSLPCIGTTHADYFYGAVPCTDVISDSQISKDYERETGVLIIETFKKAEIDYRQMRACLVACHGPFTWRTSASEAVEISIILEEIAKMSFYSIILNPKLVGIKEELLDKHYLRKHGKNAYYGQTIRKK